LPTNLRLILVYLNEAVKQLISLRLKLKKCNPAVNPGSSPALNQNDKSKAPLLRGLINGADNRTSAASPFGSQLNLLAGPVQARFGHGLLDSPPDCLAYGHAFPGSSPALNYKIKLKPLACEGF
ncbi:MAG: hypothetical protein IIZ05_05255, partial [Firmicutes bacterium]|nr:hypothetical protein [Bacillota bacterium]